MGCSASSTRILDPDSNYLKPTLVAQSMHIDISNNSPSLHVQISSLTPSICLDSTPGSSTNPKAAVAVFPSNSENSNPEFQCSLVEKSCDSSSKDLHSNSESQLKAVELSADASSNLTDSKFKSDESNPIEISSKSSSEPLDSNCESQSKPIDIDHESSHSSDLSCQPKESTPIEISAGSDSTSSDSYSETLFDHIHSTTSKPSSLPPGQDKAKSIDLLIHQYPAWGTATSPPLDSNIVSESKISRVQSEESLSDLIRELEKEQDPVPPVQKGMQQKKCDTLSRVNTIPQYSTIVPCLPNSGLDLPLPQQTASSTTAASTGARGPQVQVTVQPGFDPLIPPGAPNKECQDDGVVQNSFADNPELIFVAVLDGHGLFGKQAAKYAGVQLPKKISQSPHMTSDLQLAFQESCRSVGALMLNEFKCGFDCYYSGTTACFGVIKGNSSIVLGNVGDSRAIVAQAAGDTIVGIDLTEDDKPSDEKEKQRIEASGGRVAQQEYDIGDFDGPFRVFMKDDNIPGLAMSRSLGDGLAESLGVIPEPTCSEYFFQPDDEFLLLASDGLWEVFDSDEAAKWAADYMNHPEKMSEMSVTQALAEEAQKRWTTMDDECVVDDTTILVVRLKTPSENKS